MTARTATVLVLLALAGCDKAAPTYSYNEIGQPVTYDQAVKDCAGRGEELATIHNATSVDDIFRACPAGGCWTATPVDFDAQPHKVLTVQESVRGSFVAIDPDSATVLFALCEKVQ